MFVNFSRSRFFFFLMIRRPPRSTLFPYTRSSDLLSGDAAALHRRQRRFHLHLACRSEEHTSELQSRENLVCRLLLEKKKNSQDIRGFDCTTTASESTAGVACGPSVIDRFPG